jgi:hypothetical protein
MTGTLVNQPLGLCAPDLIIDELDGSALVSDCQTPAVTGTLTVKISNIGATDTESSFEVVFFEDTNGNGVLDIGSDKVMGTISQDSIPAGDSIAADGTVSGTVAFLDNLIHAYVDSNNEIAESDEDNNYSNTGLACELIPQPGSFDPEVEWAWTSSEVLSTFLNVMMTPAVIDLNGDDVPDIVFASTNSTGGGAVEVGVLRVLSGGDGSELFTITDPTLRINTASSVAAADIDVDGRPEILACDSTGSRLIAFEHDGTFKWRSPFLEAINWGAPAIADLDGDGFPEIVVGRQALNSSDGSVRWTGTGGRGHQGTGPLSLVADVDMNGTPDVVAGNTVYTGAGGILWQASLPDGYNAVANFDDDPFPEIVLVSGGTVRLLEHDGVVKWGPMSIPSGGRGGPPTVADYDNDGQVEIGVAGAYRYAVFETDGALKWAAITQDKSSNITGSSVFDFEGDGSAEVVYSDELKLRIYQGTNGTVLFEMALSSCTWHEYPLVADVDADGNAEIVAVANNNCGYGPQRGVYVIGDVSDSWVSTRKIWNQHTYHITNVNDDGTIPQMETNNWEVELFNNYRQNVQTEGSPFAVPDLTASFLRLDNSSCPDVIGITARIGNGGANVSGVPISVAFYDGDPNAGGMLIGAAETTQNLNPGEYEDVTLFADPALSGPHTICVLSDDNGYAEGTVNECDETNNGCCKYFSEFCVSSQPVNLDIKPGSCPNPLNVKNRGVLPVAILGTEKLDVSAIEPSSLTLTREGIEESVAPIRWDYEDVGTPFEGQLCDCHELEGDGYDDLTLKFNTQEVVEKLGLYELCGDTIPFTVRGILADSTTIAAQDCVWLLKEICDNGIDDDLDGLVDAADADCAMGACTGTAEASSYGASSDYGPSDLGEHVWYFLLPLGTIMAVSIWRRKR